MVVVPGSAVGRLRTATYPGRMDVRRLITGPWGRRLVWVLGLAMVTTFALSLFYPALAWPAAALIALVLALVIGRRR
jgi:hypothetical protein